MSNRYAPLPNNLTPSRNTHDEMEAAFDDSDDEEENISETQPLNPASTSTSQSRTAGTYDFDADYDYPPPGSPPRPSALALPNDHGNSNGITAFTVDTSAPRRRGWFGRTAANILPSHYVQRFGLGHHVPTGVVGGGSNMDGVFANVTAKPTRPVRIQQGDEAYLVPEDARAEAPPSYASAQADAVPPYWETTVHAPFSPDSMGEVVIDSLPTGSLFSFLWNMLVSVSFQFVGFLLTYLLHTTHAARLGSRAGLGVTLIQYGFSLRSKLENIRENGEGVTPSESDDWPAWGSGDPQPSEADYFGTFSHNVTTENPTGTSTYLSGAGITTTEWLSFFLMTIGWFILLTSLLGFWRVKRWERGILSPRRAAAPRTAEQTAHDVALISNLEQAFGLPIISRRDLRAGLGFGRRDSGREYVVHEEDAAGRTDAVERVPTVPAGEGQNNGTVDMEREEQVAEPDRRSNTPWHVRFQLPSRTTT